MAAGAGVVRGRRRGTLCARPSAAASVPRLRRPVDPPSRPRWVRPPAAAASSLPPRSLATPPAAHARTHLLPPRRARIGAPWMPASKVKPGPSSPRPSNRPAGPQWSRPPRSPARPRRPQAVASAPRSPPPPSRGAGRPRPRPAVASSGPSLRCSLRRERSTCGMIEEQKNVNVSKTPPKTGGTRQRPA